MITVDARIGVLFSIAGKGLPLLFLNLIHYFGAPNDATHHSREVVNPMSRETPLVSEREQQR